jgi:hypothetical protein
LQKAHYLPENDLHLGEAKFARENLVEYGLLRHFKVAAEPGQEGSPRLLVDFGRLHNKLTDARKPNITISNRKEAVLPAHVFPISVSELPLSSADQRLLAHVIRDGAF